MSFRAEALAKLRPNAKWTMRGDDITWEDETQTQPTEQELVAKTEELQADYEANQYQRDRAEQYPSIQDVVVALAEKEEGDDTMWQEITAQRAKVKADNPKPE